MSPSSQPPRLSFSPDLEPPTPTYSPNSATTSPRSSSVRGNSFQVLGYSSNPRSEASTPLPQEAQRDSFDERKRHSKRSNTTNENDYADEKSKRDSYRFSMDELRKSFIDVKHLRRPINYSYIGTIVLHVVLVSPTSVHLADHASKKPADKRNLFSTSFPVRSFSSSPS